MNSELALKMENWIYISKKTFHIGSIVCNILSIDEMTEFVMYQKNYIWEVSPHPSNVSNTKPFPHNVNPIFIDSKNWVLTETIKTKKTLAKKYAKNNIFCAWHGQFCSKSNSSKKWNPSGNPIIKTLGERIKVSDFEEDSESDEKTDSHEEYIDEEEEEVKKDTNLCHQPSYNAEEMQIYLMTDEEKKKELEFQNLERGGKKEEKKRKEEHEIVQLKKKIVHHY
ncbi:hypothetical protein M0812_19686 [Anaeramoeba flamelloides]|uniref:Uncharacterized protein n=1 Tax=Anaeramoeba flamelloides TaxID=1746091 RepID=A0AAV7Z5W4_9EUKA|nr:hypothetical protein M0812_19686 [Anaeramoeba flamelloides]